MPLTLLQRIRPRGLDRHPDPLTLEVGLGSGSRERQYQRTGAVGPRTMPLYASPSTPIPQGCLFVLCLGKGPTNDPMLSQRVINSINICQFYQFLWGDSVHKFLPSHEFVGCGIIHTQIRNNLWHCYRRIALAFCKGRELPNSPNRNRRASSLAVSSPRVRNVGASNISSFWERRRG